MRDVRQEYERIVADIEGVDVSYDLWSRPDILCKPKFAGQKNSDAALTCFEQTEGRLTEVDTPEHPSRGRLDSEEDQDEVQYDRKDIEVQTEPQPSPHALDEMQSEEMFETREAEVQTDVLLSSPSAEELRTCSHSVPDYPPPCLDRQPENSPDVPPIVMETYLGTSQQPDMELPKDKEALLELRAKFAMELMWVNQAIASRKKVSKHVVYVASSRPQCY